MIVIDFHPRFKKAYKKRLKEDPKLPDRYQQRIKLFINNPHHPLLRDHALKGEKEGYRAFSITGDIRIVYKQVDETTILFLDIGSHNQVY